MKKGSGEKRNSGQNLPILELMNFAMNKVHEAAFLVDRNARIYYVNDIACSILGYARDELLQLTVADIDPDFPAERWTGHWKDLRSHGSLLFEGRHKTKDGRIFPVEINANYFEYEGRPYNLALIRDITERKRTGELQSRLNRELHAISNCNQTLLHAVDEHTLLSEICRIICDEAGYRLAWVGYAENDEAKTIRPVARAGFDSGYIENARLSWSEETELGRGPAGIVVRTGETMFIQDFTNAPVMTPWRESAIQRGYRSGIALPLKDKEHKVFGVLLIYSSEIESITPDEIRLLEDLSADLAFGIISLRIRAEHKRVEDLLKQSESRLNEAQHFAHIGNWELNLVNNVLIWSDEIYSMFEINPEYFAASYEAFLNTIHPEDRDAVDKAYIESVKNKTSYSIDHRLQLSDGRIKYVHERCETFYNKNGKPLRSVGTVQDITERKLAEEALRTASLYARSLIEASLDPLVTISPGGKITDVNQATENVTGVVREHLIDSDFSDYFTDPEQARVGYRKVLADGFVRDYPLTIQHISGKTIDVLYNATIYKNESGEMQGVFAAARDITERKRHEQKANQLAAIVESSEDAIIGKSLDGVILSWNNGAEKIYGYTESEMLGKSISVLLSPGRENEISKILEKIRSGEYIAHYETMRRRKDGEDIHIALSVSPIRDTEGKIVAASTIGRNITEHKQAEEEIRKLNQELERRVIERTAQLESANKELEAFAYSVSHDLRAPLRGIDGFSQVLLEEYHDKFDAEGKNYLQRVRSATQRMGQLIDDLLNLSHVSRSEMTIQQVNLSKIASEIADDLHGNQPDRVVEFTIQGGILVEGDGRLLRIVLVNLIGNAWKFTSKHTSAHVEFGVMIQQEHPVYFIRDDGAGFEMKYAQKLFGAFQRLHTANEFAGSGVGLATVYRVIQRHGGKVWAEGEVEKGATFYFTIP